MPLEYQHHSKKQAVLVTAGTLFTLAVLSVAVYYLTRLEKRRSMARLIVKPALSVKIAAEPLIIDMPLYFAIDRKFKDEYVKAEVLSEPDDASALKALEDGGAELAIVYVNNLVGRAELKIVAPVANILMCGMAKDPSIGKTTDLKSLAAYRLVTNLSAKSLYYKLLEARLPAGKLERIVVHDREKEGERAVVDQPPGEVFFSTEAFCSQYAKFLSTRVYDLKASIKTGETGPIPARVLVIRTSEIAKNAELITRIREALQEGYKEVDRIPSDLATELFMNFQRLDGRACNDVSKSLLANGAYPGSYTVDEVQVLAALRLAEPSTAPGVAAALMPGKEAEAQIVAAHQAAETTYTYRLLTEEEVEEQRKKEQGEAAAALARLYRLPVKPDATPPEQIYSGPISDELYGIDFVDKQHGWVVGYYGTILATSDGGEHWRGQHADTTELLKAVQFVNDTTGWIVGVGGTILHTSDGGKHWEKQVSGTEAYLRDVFFFDSANGLATARTSLLLLTSDGGRTWKAQKMFGQRDDRINRLRQDRTGKLWAVAEFGGIYSSADRGRTWSAKQSNTKNTLTDICFLDHNVAFVTGVGGVVLVSSDAGETWQPLVSGTTENLFSTYSQDGRSAVAVGNRTILKISPNGTQGWRAGAVGTDLGLRDNGIWLYTLNSAGAEGPLLAVGMSGAMVSSLDDGDRWVLRQLAATD